MPSEKILSLNEAASRLGVSHQSLRYQVKIGNIVLKSKQEVRHGIGEWDLPGIRKMILKNKERGSRYIFNAIYGKKKHS